jgi:hypothetical protein
MLIKKRMAWWWLPPPRTSSLSVTTSRVSSSKERQSPPLRTVVWLASTAGKTQHNNKNPMRASGNDSSIEEGITQYV